MRSAFFHFLFASFCLAGAPSSLRYAGELGPELKLTWARANQQQVLSGQDQAGTPWRLALPASLTTASVFAGDLDRNGQEDILVIHPVEGEPACGTTDADVTVVLRDAAGKPSLWQSTLRLARTFRADDLPLLAADQNADGFIELAVVSCAGDVPALAGIYEIRPEGVVPLTPRAFAAYTASLRKLYRNKDLIVPGEEGPLLTMNEPAPGATLDRLSTQEWGPTAAPPAAVLSNGQQTAGWPRPAVGASGFELTRSTGDLVTDLLELTARRTPVRLGTSRALQAYPAYSQLRQPLTARLVTGEPRERAITVVDAPVPPSVLDVSYFVSPGAECFAIHVGNSAVGVMRAKECDAAASLRSRGLTAAPFVAHHSIVWQPNPAAREWSVFNAADLAAGAAAAIRFEAVGQGTLTGAARAGEFILAQWRDGASSWLSLHRETGAALTGALPVPATDQLLSVDENRGLTFLRWENGRPALWREVPARVEWSAR